jgi:Na+-translocating ferredoxin:NAD+ oxidoreductase subunit G
MKRLIVLAAMSLLAVSAEARVFMTQQQAVASAFPAGARVVRQAFFLTKAQVEAARKSSGLDFTDQLVVRYAGFAGDRLLGFAYFDSHRVRTLPETVMVVITPDAKIDRVSILSFDEPPDYLPKPRWLDQFKTRKLDDELSLNRAVRPISGASLSGRAILNASRKMLALHQAIGNASPK